MSVINSVGQTSRKRSLIYSAAISNYVVLVLLLFQPFGINNYKHHFDVDLTFVAVLLLFDIVIFVVLLAINAVLDRLFSRSRKLWIDFVVSWAAISSVSFYIYNMLGNWHDYHFTSYLEFIYTTFTLLVAPYVVIFVLDYRVRRVRSMILFKSSSGKADLLIEPSHLLFIKAEDNYINIHFEKNGVVQKRLVRNTLTETKKSLPVHFIQCHRSYVVNPDNIEILHFEGKRSELKMKYFDQPIPVTPNQKEAILIRHQ